jgi:hypothetical protein
MYISYSGFKKYKWECEHQYLHSYIFKTQCPDPDDRVGALYGSTIGEIFERFYADRMWAGTKVLSALIQLAEPTMNAIIARETEKGGVFLWKKNKTYKSAQDVLDHVLLSLPQALAVIREHRLLGRDAAAEVKLDSVIDGHTIGGRADFIMTRVAPHNDLVILDGKGTKHLEYVDLYVDERQLLWYCMLHLMKFKKLPAKVGFIYWKAASVEAAMDWREVDKEKILALKNEVVSTLGELEVKRRLPVAEQLKAFAPNPKESRCRLCPYVFTCPSGQTILSKEKPDLSDLPNGVGDISMG